MTMAFASVSLPPLEEAMEMSSPAAGQHFDGDIDIDFDDYGGDQINDDEHMLEDGDLMRPGTAVTDDLMADIDQPQVTSVPNIVEEEMQDSDEAAQPVEQQMNDEELIDYDDEFYPDQPQDAPIGTTFQAQDTPAKPDTPVAPAVESRLLTEVKSSTVDDEVDEEIVRGPEDVAVEPIGTTVDATAPDATNSTSEGKPDHVQPVLHEEVETVGQEDTSDNVAAHLDPAAEALPNHEALTPTSEDIGAADQSTLASGHEHNHEQDVTGVTGVTGVAQKMPPQHLGKIDVGGSSTTDAPQTPTDQTLHAMTVQFGEYQWPLFKSRSQPDGLLKDDNLLNVSLTDLLHNLRQRLALKVSTDDMITEARDLVLNFDIFGLMVAESSLHASATSLNDVLGIYLNLHENDGITEHDAPPLFMTLTTQLNFSNSIASLKQLAATGAGLPSAAEHVDAEDADFVQEDNVTAGSPTGEATQPDEGGTTNDEEYDPEENETQEDFTGQIYEYYEGDQEEYDGYEGDHLPLDDQEDVPEPEDDGDDHESFEEQEAKDLQADQATSVAVAAEVPDQTVSATTGDVEEAAEPESDANSNGVRDHDTTLSNGEYSFENTIPWDDANLTGDIAELHADDGEDDSSATVNTPQSPSAEEAFDYPANEEHDHAPAAGEALELAAADAQNSDQPQADVAGAETTAETEQDAEPIESADLSYEHDYDHENHSAEDDNDRTQHEADGEQFDPGFDLLDDDGNEPFGDEDDDAVDTLDHSQAPELDEDDIGFDLDDEEIAPASPSPAASTPRLVKRPLEEAADDEDRIDFDEPELKKARAD